MEYELELALLRDITSIFVQNKEFSRFHNLGLENVWGRFWDRMKDELTNNYLATYRRMVMQFGGIISENLEENLTRKIDDSCEIIKGLLNKDSRYVTNTFFRFGTLPYEMAAGRLYSPLNDLAVYLG